MKTHLQQMITIGYILIAAGLLCFFLAYLQWYRESPRYRVASSNDPWNSYDSGGYFWHVEEKTCIGYLFINGTASFTQQEALQKAMNIANENGGGIIYITPDPDLNPKP